ETVVEHAVELGRLVDTGVLGGGVVDQAAEVPRGHDRVDPLPEQVAGVHLGPDVGGGDLRGPPRPGPPPAPPPSQRGGGGPPPPRLGGAPPRPPSRSMVPGL